MHFILVFGSEDTKLDQTAPLAQEKINTRVNRRDNQE
jgi:hypothetical protein